MPPSGDCAMVIISSEESGTDAGWADEDMHMVQTAYHYKYKLYLLT